MTPHETSSVRAALVGGVFIVLAACITGAFLVLNTAFEKGFIVIGPSVQGGNPNSQPTNTLVAAASTAITQLTSTQQPTALAVRTIVAPEIATPTAKPQQNVRPPNLNLKTGNVLNPSQEWLWVCTGDFAFTNSVGNRVEPYDSQALTGLILVLDTNSHVTLSGPTEAQGVPIGHLIGDCRAYSVDAKDTGISDAISLQLTVGCGSKCSSVHVVEVGNNGFVVGDYWKP